MEKNCLSNSSDWGSDFGTFFISFFTILSHLWRYLSSLLQFLSSRVSKLAQNVLDEYQKRKWIFKGEIKIVKEEIKNVQHLVPCTCTAADKMFLLWLLFFKPSSSCPAFSRDVRADTEAKTEKQEYIYICIFN